jgi:hypothetical protein
MRLLPTTQTRHNHDRAGPSNTIKNTHKTHESPAGPPPRPKSRRPNALRSRRQRPSPRPTHTGNGTGTSTRRFQTGIMHHRIIRQHRHHAPANPLMTHPTHPLLRDHDPPIPPSLPARNTVTQEQQRLACEERRLAQARQHARLVDGAVGAAHAAAEVRLQLPDGEAVGYKG